MGYPYQTTVQNGDAIRFGSMKVEVGASTSSLTNIGVARGVTFEEQLTYAWIGGDNAALQRRVTMQRAVISGTFVEYDPSAYNTMRGGIDVYTSSTGDGGKKIIESGGKHPQSARVVQLTNYTVSSDPTTKYLRITVWNAYYDGNMTMAFMPDEDENPLEIPFSFIGTPGSTRAVGQKLYKIEDQQSTS